MTVGPEAWSWAAAGNVASGTRQNPSQQVAWRRRASLLMGPPLLTCGNRSHAGARGFQGIQCGRRRPSRAFVARPLAVLKGRACRVPSRCEPLEHSRRGPVKSRKEHFSELTALLAVGFPIKNPHSDCRRNSDKIWSVRLLNPTGPTAECRLLVRSRQL